MCNDDQIHSIHMAAKKEHQGLRWLLLTLLLAGIGLTLVYRDRFDVTAVQLWVQQAGTAGPLLFMAIYAIGTVLFLPGSLLTLAGGALFGPVLGTLYNLTGATVGAGLAFLLARYLTSNWVAQKTGGRLGQLQKGVEKEGWRFVAFVRLVPLFPFNLLNYALGLTRIRFSHYLIASWFCMLPGAVAYTYLGYAGHEAVVGSEGMIQKALLALALLALVAFLLPRLATRFRQVSTLGTKALRERLYDSAGLLLLDVRNPTDYSGEPGYIEGSRNIPLETLRAHLDELIPYQQSPIALICTTDRRSRTAAKILGNEGFGDIQVVTGGITQWQHDGLPLHKSRSARDSIMSRTPTHPGHYRRKP